GFGTVYQPTYRDKKTGEIKKQAIWWIQYCRNGKVIRESSESTKEADGWKLLKRRHGEIAAGKPMRPDVNRTKCDTREGRARWLELSGAPRRCGQPLARVFW